MSGEEPEVIDLTGPDENDSEQDDQEDSSDQDEEEDSGQSSDHSDDSVEVQINSDTRSKLYLSLAALPETQVRSILNQLIEQVPAVEYALTRELVTLKRKLDHHDYERHLERCKNCYEEFDTQLKKRNNECSFHPGSLEPDYASFPDWDEDVHGPIDNEETRRHYPENFIWSCCQADGNSEGCVHGVHQSANAQKKARVAA
ncbi:hypothetical protein DFJ43DRAFT_575362 [Lentinula guzmanii]|uniref:C2H2-type domain-containing protein n=2 Tax=Lentinula TaxID=5352 RepID=A0AA38MSC8_9AGAR|nr:hypothetical protein DFJ43DRAFT_575362 [Lentinula guzmanii]KAJ3787189.1 hypothetical protein GGU10DRAFT_152268 [Lentinula aff. detonsa]